MTFDLNGSTALTPRKQVKFTNYSMPVIEALAVKRYLSFAISELTDELQKMQKDKTTAPSDLQQAIATHALMTAWMELQIEQIDNAIAKKKPLS